MKGREPNYYEIAWLNTIGKPSNYASVCKHLTFENGVFIRIMKLYHVPDLGIVGTLFQTSDGKF